MIKKYKGVLQPSLRPILFFIEPPRFSDEADGSTDEADGADGSTDEADGADGSTDEADGADSGSVGTKKS
jgi:hypothetical protein